MNEYYCDVCGETILGQLFVIRGLDKDHILCASHKQKFGEWLEKHHEFREWSHSGEYGYWESGRVDRPNEVQY